MLLEKNKIWRWLFSSDSIRVEHCLWHQKGTSSRTRWSFACSFYILFEKQLDSFCKSIIKIQLVMFSLSFSRQNWYGELYCKTWGRKGNLDVWSNKLSTVSTRMLINENINVSVLITLTTLKISSSSLVLNHLDG